MQRLEYIAFVPASGEVLSRGTYDELACDLSPLAGGGFRICPGRGTENALDGARVTLADGREVRILETAESEAARLGVRS